MKPVTEIVDGFVASSNVTASGEYLRVLVIDKAQSNVAFDAYEPSARTKCLKCGESTVHGCNPLSRDGEGKVIPAIQKPVRPDSCPACGAMDQTGQAWGLTSMSSVPKGTKIKGSFRLFLDPDGAVPTEEPSKKVLPDGTVRETTYYAGVFEKADITKPAGGVVSVLTAE